MIRDRINLLPDSPMVITDPGGAAGCRVRFSLLMVSPSCQPALLPRGAGALAWGIGWAFAVRSCAVSVASAFF